MYGSIYTLFSLLSLLPSKTSIYLRLLLLNTRFLCPLVRNIQFLTRNKQRQISSVYFGFCIHRQGIGRHNSLDRITAGLLRILTCWCCSQTLELCHSCRRLSTYRDFVFQSCILFTKCEHVGYSFLVCCTLYFQISLRTSD